MEIYSANLTVQVSKKTCKASMLHQLHPDVYGHSTDLYAYCYVERWSVGTSFSWASVLFALSTTIKSFKKHIWLAVKVGPDMNYAQNDLNKAIQSKWQRETKIIFTVSISYGYLHGWILTHLVRSTATSWWLASGSVGLRLFCHLQKLSSVLSAWWFIINPSSFSCNIKNHNCHF